MVYDQALYDFRLAVYNFLEFSIGHNRIFYAKTNFPRPKQQYITYRIVREEVPEYVSYVGFDAQGREQSDMTVQATVEVMCIKDEIPDTPPVIPKTPRSVINQIVHDINKKEVRYRYFNSCNIGYLSNETLRDRAIPIDNHDWEQRTSVQLKFHFIIRDVDASTDLSGVVETVLFQNTTNEGETEIVLSETVGPVH